MNTRIWGITAALVLAACGKAPNASDGPNAQNAPNKSASPGQPLQGNGTTTEDNSAKQPPRLLPQEVYIRSYLQLFGGLSPLDTQRAAQGQDGNALFDTWTDYLTSLGMPDYYVDIPRATQTNTLMLATFERMGIALCDRAVERDLQGQLSVDKRVVFAFDVPKTELDEVAFATRFDALHRTFLGYPAKLAPASRTPGFFQLYHDTVEAGAAQGVPASRFTPHEAGWAAVCYGLIRHPEFHLY